MIGRPSAFEIRPVGEYENAGSDDQRHNRESKIGTVIFGQSITPDIKQVRRHKRHQQDVGIQVAPGCVIYQHPQVLAENCQQYNQET